MADDTGIVKRTRGRPKGSKNKPKIGRPKGRKSEYTMTPAALLQRRNISGSLPARTDEEKEYNNKLIAHIMQIHAIAENADKHDLNSLKSCFVNYLKLCQQDGFPARNLAAYASMGFNQETFNQFSKKDDPEIREFAGFVRSTCAMFREMVVSDGKLNPVIGIFWQRNFDGLRNDTEQVQAIQEEDLGSSSPAYKEKYRDLIGE